MNALKAGDKVTVNGYLAKERTISSRSAADLGIRLRA
jgi:hypothetical protein